MAIRYDKKLNQEINRTIKNFNQKIARLEKQERELLPSKITKKELSVTEKVIKIRDILKKKRKVNFEDLFENSSKEEVIVSFLSILEMLKKDEIIVKQENNFNNIIVCLKGGV